MVEQTTVALIVFMDIISVELGMYKADEYAVMMMMLMLTTNMMAVFMMATMSAACCQSWCVCVSSYGTSTNSYQCVVEQCKVRVLQARHSKDGALLLVVLTPGVLARHDLHLLHLRA